MHTNFLSLLVILLGFSYVFSISAIPRTRAQNLNEQDTSVMPTLAQGALKLENGEEMVVDMDEEIMMERRIDLEIEDYGGTGANNDHNPKSPGMVNVQKIH